MYSLWYEQQGGARELFTTVEDTMGNITGIIVCLLSKAKD